MSYSRPSVNLKFFDILQEKRKDAEIKELIFIGRCGLHIMHHSFQNASQWNQKKVLIAMFKIFLESPSRRADYEKKLVLNLTRPFCTHRWLENEIVAKQAWKAWPKVTEFAEYWQPRQGMPDNHKSFHVLLSCNNDDLVPLKFAFFEEIAHKLNKCLRRFQTDAPMVPFLADTTEEISRELCNWSF